MAPYKIVDKQFFFDVEQQIKPLVETYFFNLGTQKGEIDIAKHLDSFDNLYHFFSCPYCNHFGLLSTSRTLPEEPYVCIMCGETDPFYKVEDGIRKAMDIWRLPELIEGQFSKEDNEDIERLLFEQTIVIMATVVEVFLRDIYSTFLNIRYVQNHKSLYKRFYQESKNEFTNIGKANKKFNNDLNIDIEQIIGKDMFNDLNLLMLKRNCIVHNVGIVDKIFKEQSGIKCEIKNIIPISKKEINDNIRILEKIINSFAFEFQKEIDNKFNNDIKEFLRDEKKGIANS